MEMHHSRSHGDHAPCAARPGGPWTILQRVPQRAASDARCQCVRPLRDGIPAHSGLPSRWRHRHQEHLPALALPPTQQHPLPPETNFLYRRNQPMACRSLCPPTRVAHCELPCMSEKRPDCPGCPAAPAHSNEKLLQARETATSTGVALRRAVCRAARLQIKTDLTRNPSPR
jgi:hypothetical protein